MVSLLALGELVYAARGLGCFWNGEVARVSATSGLDQALLLSTDFGVCEQYGFGPAAESLQHQVQARRTWGCLWACARRNRPGRHHARCVMNIGTVPLCCPFWNVAGGTFTDWDGKRTIHGGNAISTNGLLFDSVMEIVRET